MFTTLGSAGHPCMEGANTCTPVVFCRRHLITTVGIRHTLARESSLLYLIQPTTPLHPSLLHPFTYHSITPLSFHPFYLYYPLPLYPCTPFPPPGTAFVVCVVDEAAQCCEPATLIALRRWWTDHPLRYMTINSHHNMTVATLINLPHGLTSPTPP